MMKNPKGKSFPCNGELIKYLRNHLGWTQEQMAQESGYGERLIRKAEAGQSISVETIRDLSDTLSTTERPVTPEELMCDPLRLSRSFFEHFNTYQSEVVSKIRHFLSDEPVFAFACSDDTIPFGGEHVGIEAIERMFKSFFAVLEIPNGWRFEPELSIVGDGNQVIAEGEEWSHPHGQPLEKPISILARLTFEHGKLARYEVWFDSAAGANALGNLK